MKGILKGNRVIADDSTFADSYYFLDGVMGIASGNKFIAYQYGTDRYGNFLTEPVRVFEDIKPADLLVAAGFSEADAIETLRRQRERKMFVVTEQTPPVFPGGDASLNIFLREAVRYPEAALKKKITGNVWVSFVITNEGKILDVKTLGNKPLGYGIEEEAIRVIQSMPDWIPGTLDGEPKSVEMRMQVPFVIK